MSTLSRGKRKQRKSGVLKGITHERLVRSLRMNPRFNQKLINIEIPEGFGTVEPAIRPSRNQYFNEVVQELIDMHDKKNHDYANEDNPFSNFDIASRYLKRRGINLTPNQQIESMKGTKFARLVNIVLNDIEKPNFESEDDSELDFVVYYLLARAEARRPSTATS